MTECSGGKREWNYWTFTFDVARVVALVCGSSDKYVYPADIVYYEYKCLYLFVRLIGETAFDHHNNLNRLSARFGNWHYDQCFDLCDICDALDRFDHQPVVCDVS